MERLMMMTLTKMETSTWPSMRYELAALKLRCGTLRLSQTLMLALEVGHQFKEA
jgi:hypothetical protein